MTYPGAPIVHFVPRSENTKTGPIAVSMTEQSSCPRTCPFADNGCYAAYGRTLLHWKKVPERGTPWPDFIHRLRRLNQNDFFRHNVAGDLPHIGGYLIHELVINLSRAVRRLRAAWTYTHHELNAHNLAIIRAVIANGLVINVSCEDTRTAALNALRGLPTVCVVPPEAPTCFRMEGVTFVQCPATIKENINCNNCGGPRGIPLCARSDRKVVVTFPAHGTGRRKAAEIARRAA
jgi:hypothetical protein